MTFHDDFMRKNRLALCQAMFLGDLFSLHQNFPKPEFPKTRVPKNMVRHHGQEFSSVTASHGGKLCGGEQRTPQELREG